MRGIRPILEVASNSQSPSHVKVQRSASATTKPRRYSHGGDSNASNVQSNTNSTHSNSNYKRQNTLDVNSVKESSITSTNGPQSSISSKPIKSPPSLTSEHSSALTPQVFNSSKIIGIGSLRQRTTSPMVSSGLKNALSAIPRRNTYNYNENKSASIEKTIVSDMVCAR